MPGVESINMDTPQETRKFEHGQAQLVTVGGSTVGRFTFEPGWRWSTSVKPIVGTDRCENHHVGYAISGHMNVGDAGGVESGIGGRAAGGTTLVVKVEGVLDGSGSSLGRGACDLARDGRQDRARRRLEALLLVGNPEHLLVLSGTGDVIEPDEGIAAIGSADASKRLRELNINPERRPQTLSLTEWAAVYKGFGPHPDR